MTKAGVLKGFDSLPKVSDLSGVAGVDLSGLAIQGRSYLGQIATHGLSDSAIEQWCIKCEAAAAKREAAYEADRLAGQRRRMLWLLITGLACLALLSLVLVVAGSTVRSRWRSAAVQTAIQQQAWQEALTLDPDNVAALVGLARKRLGETPPDINAAFADLDRAERVAPGSDDIKMTRAAAYVARALENVAKTQLDDASKSLIAAERLTATNYVLHPARHALAMAWLARSIQLARVDKLDEAYDAIRQVQRYTDEQSSVKPAEEAIHDARVMRLEKHVLAGRLMEAEKELKEARRLLPERDVSKADVLLASSWIREGEAAIAKRDFQAALKACVEARKYGAPESRLDSLIADAVFQQAAALLSAGDSKQAVSKVNEALARNESAVLKALKDPQSDALRVIVIQDYRRQVELAWERGDHEAAIALVTRAGAMDPKAGEWLGEILADQRGALSSLPEKVIARLPPRSLVLLPASEFQKLTPSAVAALPRDVVANIPLGALSRFSSDAMVRLPSLYNSIGMELRFLPPGKFRSSEEARTVTLSRPYLIGATEVTNGQWKRVMGDTTSYWKEDNLPVNGCRWEEASEFCRKLSALPEERAANRRYRLPTEAEWEYACRAGTTTRFSFGDDEAELVDYAWCEANSAKQVHPVRQKKPNSWGLYDMHGNVWEWCSDWHADHPSRDETNPTGPATGYMRVFRGGCWIYGAGSCPSSHRPGLDPSPSHYGRLGFRVVLEVP
jgi:tetratricopeptide (TPR) repeat protein